MKVICTVSINGAPPVPMTKELEKQLAYQMNRSAIEAQGYKIKDKTSD